MKSKHLFASVAMAAVLAGCSQEELTGLSNNNLQNLGDRPMVEAPILTIGGDVESRMTAEEVSANGFANVKWQEGDGFGAAVMDIYRADGTTFEEKYEVVDYINSNVLFKTEDGKNFYADASMPEGNHLFYAPFNVNNISRNPLATQVPLEQVVKPTTNGMPSNSAIAAFYEDKTSPVLVAYDIVDGTPKTNLEIEMHHIYALPLVTLELGENFLVYDDEGEYKNKKNADDEKVPVYESSVTIDAIKFVQKESVQNIVTRGYINNTNLKAKLKKTANGVAWNNAMYENAATADIVTTATETATVDAYETITVTFEGGLKLEKGKKGQFFMVLPGANYTADQLAVYVYATIDGKSYVSAASSEALVLGEEAPISPKRAARLLPGLPYAADEYTAEGEKKASAGTSMTYTIGGAFMPAVDVEREDYVQIKTYTDLEKYVEEMAYRGETLVQVTKEDAVNMLNKEEGYDEYDAKKHFVITATEEEAIKLDDAFVATFENACVVTGKSAKIEFLANQKNLVLGDIEWTANEKGLFQFGNTNSDVVWAAGNVTLKAAPAENVKLLSTATVDLNSALTDVVTVENNSNATINLNSTATHTIKNIYGTLNVNVAAQGSITNGYTGTYANAAATKYAEMVVASNDNAINASIDNTKYGKISINRNILTVTNNGEITLIEKEAELNVSGEGTVNNTVGAKVDNGGNIVYAEVEGMSDLELFGQDQTYDDLTGLTKLIIKGTWTINEDVALNTPETKNIRTIDFVSGSSINVYTATLDLSTVTTINIKADVIWTGRKDDRSFVKYAESAVVKAVKVSPSTYYTLTVRNLGVMNVAKVTTASELVAAIAAGGDVALAADVELSKGLKVTGDVTLKLNGNSISWSEDVNNGSALNAIRNASLIKVDGGTLTIEGEGAVESNIVFKYYNADESSENSSNPAISVHNGGSVTINGGSFITGSDKMKKYTGAGTLDEEEKSFTDQKAGVPVIEVENGTVEINGGTFQALYPCSAGDAQYITMILNAYSTVAEDTKVFTLNGGTFLDTVGDELEATYWASCHDSDKIDAANL